MPAGREEIVLSNLDRNRWCDLLAWWEWANAVNHGLTMLSSSPDCPTSYDTVSLVPVETHSFAESNES